MKNTKKRQRSLWDIYTRRCMQVGLRHRDRAADVDARPTGDRNGQPSIRATSSQHCSRFGKPSSLAVQSIRSIPGHATAPAAASGQRIYVIMVMKYRGTFKCCDVRPADRLFIASYARHMVHALHGDRSTKHV